MGGEHAVAFVVEELVEGLAADPRLFEDVGDRGRLVALGGGDAHDRRQQALALGADDHLARQPVAPARQPPVAQVFALVGHRGAGPSAAGAVAGQLRLRDRLVVAGEGEQGDVDDFGQQLGQLARCGRRRSG